MRQPPRDATSQTGLFCEGPQQSSFSASWHLAETVGIKLRTGGVRALLGVAAKELSNTCVPLERLWGSHAASLVDAMSASPCARARLSVLEAELVRRSGAFDKHDRAAVLTSRLIERGGGQLRIRELANLSGHAERTLRQRFEEWAGLTPKAYARVVRLRACVSRMRDVARLGRADVVHGFGYYDQAHMIKDFRELTGLTPCAFAGELAECASAHAPAVGAGSVSPEDRRLYRALGLVSEWLD